METLFHLFKPANEHRFPFELLEYFELSTVRELGEVASKQVFHEITFHEKGASPKAYLQRSFQDFPMQAIPVRIVFQRNLYQTIGQGMAYERDYSEVAKRLHLAPEILDFLTQGYSNGLPCECPQQASLRETA